MTGASSASASINRHDFQSRNIIAVIGPYGILTNKTSNHVALPTINILSLCAGIGGLDLGAHAALRALGHAPRTVCYVEREAFGVACLVAAMGRGALDAAPVWSDLETFDAEAWRGTVDLIIAGFPCQPASLAGKGLGEEDERWLWPLIESILRGVEPRLVFLENVPGLVSRDDGALLGLVLGSLAGLGFNAEWGLLKAAEVGASHLRERFFCLAYRDSFTGPSPRLRDRSEPSGNDARGRGEDLADSSGCGRAEGELLCPGQPEPRRRRAPVADAPGVGWGQGRTKLKRRNRLSPSRLGGGPVLPDPDGIEMRDAEGRRDGSDRSSAPEPRDLGFPPGPEDAEGWGRWLAAGGPAPAKPRLRRGADGLPDRLDRIRALGNGVVPAQAAAAFVELWRRAMKEQGQ